MKGAATRRVWGAVHGAFAGAVAAAALANVAHTVRITPPAAPPGVGPSPDPALRAEARFAALRRTLAERGAPGRIGYVGDVSSQALPRDAAATEAYYRAQFALAPVVLDPACRDCSWAVGNFAGVPPALPGWTLVRNFGGGVLLLRR